MRHTLKALLLVGLLVAWALPAEATFIKNTVTNSANLTDGQLLVGDLGAHGIKTFAACSDGLVVTWASGAIVCGSISAASPALDNLASVAIATALIPASAAGVDFGSATKPWKDFFLAGSSGTPGTNNFKFTGASTSGTRTITLPDASITVAGIDSANAWADGIKQTFNPNNTNAGVNVGSNATDPSSPANGDIWYDSGNNTLDARINGATVNLGSGGSSITPRDNLKNTTGTTYDWVPYDLCDGSNCVSSVYLNEEFCGNNPSSSANTNGDLMWQGWDGVGTGSVAKGASTFPNVCFYNLASGATSGNFTGISLNDVGTNGYGGFGDLHGNLNWEYHWIFKFSSATTPAFYLGVASNPQSALIPTDWIGLQFDTSNSDTTNMTFVCKKGATVARTDTTIAADTTFHHLRVWSTTTDQINFELYSASGAIQKQSLAVCSSASIPTSSMIPFAQAGTQAASARTLSIDRFSYKMRGIAR